MADESVTSEIKFDTRFADAALKRLAPLIEKYNLSVDNLAKVTRKANSESKLYSLYLDFIGKAGERLAVVLEDIGDGVAPKVTHEFTKMRDISKEIATATAEASKQFNSQKKILTDLAQAHDKLQQAVKKTREAEQARQLLKNVLTQNVSTQNASQKEIVDLNSAINKVVRDVSQGKFTLKEFIGGLSAIGKQGTSAFLGLDDSLSKALSGTLKAVGAIGNEYTVAGNKSKAASDKAIAASDKALNKLFDETEALRKKAVLEQTAARTAESARQSLIKLLGSGGTLSKATDKEVIGLNKAINTVSKSIGEGTFTLTEFTNTLADVGVKGSSAFLGLNKEMTQAVGTTLNAIIKLGETHYKSKAKIKEAYDKTIAKVREELGLINEETAAIQAKTQAEAHAAVVFIAAKSNLNKAYAAGDTKGLEKQDALLGKISALFTKAAFTAKDYNTVLNALAGGSGGVAALSDSHQKLAALIIRFRDEGVKSYARVKQGAQEYIDLINTMRDALQRAAEVQNTTNVNQIYGKRRADIVGNQLTALIPPKIDTAGLERANAIISSIKRQFLSGKASLLDYMRAQASLNGQVGELTEAQKRLANSIRALNKELGVVGSTGKDAGQKILLTFSQVAKLFIIQTLHRAVTNLIGTFRQAVTSAIEFGIKIGEILTISQNGGKNFADWSREVRGLSDAFGQDTATVAKGTYDALSNQVITASNSFGFLSEALKFSQTTASTAENGINLLSSALKSFRLDTGETQRVAAIMFKTIELGRVTADEMANSFGRIGSLAHSLGINLEETNAALAVLTNQGIKFDEAATLINNIMLKLIKPTDEMKLLFREWGVESGQAAIATFGFEGVLKKFDQEAQKGTARLGDLFNELRAVRAAVGLTGDAFKDYQGVLGQLSNAALPTYLKAQELVMTDAKKLQIEFNKVKNFFTVDLGQQMVKALVLVSNSMGGLVGTIKFLLRNLAGLVIGFTAFKVVNSQLIGALGSSGVALYRFGLSLVGVKNASIGAEIAAKRARLAFASMGGPALIIGTIVAGLASSFISAADAAHQAENNLENIFQEIAPKYQELAQLQIDANNRIGESDKKLFDERLQNFNIYAASVQAANNKLVDALVERNKASLEEFKTFIDIFNDRVNASVAAAKKNFEDFSSIGKKATADADKIINRAPNEKFDRSVDAVADPQVQAALIENEIRRLNALIQDAFDKGKAKTLEELDGVNKIAERAAQLSEQLAELRARQNVKLSKQEEDLRQKENTAAANRIKQQVKNAEAELAELNRLIKGGAFGGNQLIKEQQRARLLEEKIKKEKELEQALLDSAVNQANNVKAIKASEELLLDITTQRLIILRDIGIEAKKQADAAAEELKTRTEAKAKFDAAANAFVKFNPDVDSDTVAGKNVADTTAELARQEAEARANFDKLAEELKANAQATGLGIVDLDEKIRTRRLQLFEEFEAKRKGLEAKAQAEQIAKSAEAAKKAVEDEQKKNDELIKQQVESVARLEGFSKALRDIVAKTDPAGPIGSDVDIEKINRILDLIKEFSTSKSPVALSQIKDELAALDAQVAQLVTKNVPEAVSNFAGLFSKEQAEQAKNLLFVLRSTLKQIGQEQNEITGNAKQLSIYMQGLAAINAELAKWTGQVSSLPEVHTSTTITLTQQLQTTLELVGKVGAAYEGVAKAIGAAAAAYNIVAGFIPTNNVLGGSIPAFAGGGFVKKGFDTQVAAVAPGEFIMNRQSTMRNYTQFVAMNQGRQPRNFVQGGNVTTVGDVNITVQGGNNSAQTVSEIGRGLQREIRMKRLKFN